MLILCPVPLGITRDWEKGKPSPLKSQDDEMGGIEDCDGLNWKRPWRIIPPQSGTEDPEARVAFPKSPTVL